MELLKMFSKLRGKQDNRDENPSGESEEIAVASEDAGETDSELSEAAHRALASKFRAAAFGEIISLLMRSPRHKNLRLSDLEQFVVPAIVTRQYNLGKVKSKDNPNAAAIPAGVAFWARVSDDVDKRLTGQLGEPLLLKPDEWTSGDNYWLLDIVAVPKVAAFMIDELKHSVFVGRSFKLRRLVEGKVIVETMHGAQEANTDSPV
jgi:cytolysin-activating lysine-acyltransferase